MLHGNTGLELLVEHLHLLVLFPGAPLPPRVAMAPIAQLLPRICLPGARAGHIVLCAAHRHILLRIAVATRALLPRPRRRLLLLVVRHALAVRGVARAHALTLRALRVPADVPCVPAVGGHGSRRARALVARRDLLLLLLKLLRSHRRSVVLRGYRLLLLLRLRGRHRRLLLRLLLLLLGSVSSVLCLLLLLRLLLLLLCTLLALLRSIGIGRRRGCGRRCGLRVALLLAQCLFALDDLLVELRPVLGNRPLHSLPCVLRVSESLGKPSGTQNLGGQRCQAPRRSRSSQSGNHVQPRAARARQRHRLQERACTQPEHTFSLSLIGMVMARVHRGSLLASWKRATYGCASASLAVRRFSGSKTKSRCSRSAASRVAVGNILEMLGRAWCGPTRRRTCGWRADTQAWRRGKRR